VVYKILNDKKRGCYFKERASTEVGGVLEGLRARENQEVGREDPDLYCRDY
jgi:hypothetical protein